jgi:hypothetical protein
VQDICSLRLSLVRTCDSYCTFSSIVTRGMPARSRSGSCQDDRQYPFSRSNYFYTF